MKKAFLQILFFILLWSISAKAERLRDSIYRSLHNKNFTLQCTIEPMFMPHNHDGTFEGYGVFVNYESPLWPLLLRDYLDRTYQSKEHTYIKFTFNNQMYWRDQLNQLNYNNDTLFLCYHHLLSEYTSEFWRVMRNEIFTLIDYGIFHKEEIITTQQIQRKSKYGHEHLKSIPETKMIEIIKNTKIIKRVADFFQQTPIYPHINYEPNRDHNLETDPLLGSYFQNDSIHLFNRKNNKVFFKSPEICQFLQIGHYNYIFQPNFREGLIYNYNAKMDKLFILIEPERQNKNIYAYHGENSILGIVGWNGDYRKEIGIYYLDKFIYNSTKIDYIFRNDNEAPSYYRNAYYEDFLEHYPPPPKSYSYFFAYLVIAILAAFSVWFIKLNLPAKF